VILLVIEDVNFDLTPLAWKEMYTYYDEDSIKSRKELIDYLKENDDAREWIDKIHIKKDIVKKWGEKIRRLLFGYALLDIGSWMNLILYERNQMWRLFEDLTYEILREVLQKMKNCMIIRVDKWPGFRGLDYVIINDESGDWKVGIQCKRYISTGIPENKLHKFGSYSRNTSATNLLKEAKKLRQKYEDKKFLLATFEVYYNNKKQFNRFLKLKNKSEWDAILVFNEIQKPITQYKLNCDGLENVLKWC